MSLNVYLQRALRSTKPEIKLPAKAVSGGLNYMDRLLGVSARKMRTMADTAGHISKRPGSLSFGNNDRLADKLNSKAKTLTSQSNATRIKTGLVIGGGALAHKAMSNYNNTTQYQFDPNQYQY